MTFTVDSAGVQTVVTHALAWTDTLDLPLGPVLAVYGRETDPAPLASVAAARRLPSGNVVILDPRMARAVEYDAQGLLRRTLGRAGGGPGEFGSANGLALLADTVVVYDIANRRLTHFSPTDAPARIVTVTEDVFGQVPRQIWAMAGGLVTLSGSFRDGEVLARGQEAELTGVPATIRWVDPSAGHHVLLAREGRASEELRQGMMWISAPFGRSTYVATAGSRGVFTTSESFSLVAFSETGVTARYSWPGGDSPLDRDEIDRLQDSLRWAARGDARGLPAAPDFLFDYALQPATKPSFGGVLMAPSGLVLARAFAPMARRSQVWWLVDASGAFLGCVRAPGAGDILEIGDGYALLLVLDDYDVPSVHLHALDWSALPIP